MSCQRKLRHYYKNLIFKDKCYCYLCGKKILNCSDLSLDHILPKKLGGQGFRKNLLPTHKVCNCEKDCMTIYEYVNLKWNIKVK